MSRASLFDDAPDAELRYEAVDTGQRGQHVAVDPLVTVVLAHRDLKQIIRVATHQMRFVDLAAASQRLLEALQRVAALVLKSHRDEDDRRVAERGARQLGAVAANESGRLQKFHATMRR